MLDTIEGEVVNESTTLAVRQGSAAAAWVPSFAESVDAMVAKVEAKHDFFRRVMKKGTHYGTIPGVKPKEGEPERFVLFKPGAELLLTNMGLNPVCEDASPPVERHATDDAEGEYTYRRRCKIYRQVGPGEHERMLVAQAEGSCTSLEVKYRWRESKRVCPSCGLPAIIKGKAEYGGGWICFKKQGGCGAKYEERDPDIASQTVGRKPNPDLADVANTILKMADKRAIVAATLIATGCSDIFTQDIEDEETHDSNPPSSRPGPTPEQQAHRKGVHAVLDYCAKFPVSNPPGRELLESMTVEALGNLYGNLQREVKERSVPAGARVAAAPTPGPSQAPPTSTEPGNAPLFPPKHDGTPPGDALKRLFAILNDLGHKEKADRLGYAASFGLDLTSYSELSRGQAVWLADRAQEELRGPVVAGDNVWRGKVECPACEAQPGELHVRKCPEGAPE